MHVHVMNGRVAALVTLDILKSGYKILFRCSSTARGVIMYVDLKTVTLAATLTAALPVQVADAGEWRQLKDEFFASFVGRAYGFDIMHEIRRPLQEVRNTLRDAQNDIEGDMDEERKLDIVFDSYTHMRAVTAPVRTGMEAPDSVVARYEAFADEFDIDLSFYHDLTFNLIQVFREEVSGIVLDHQRHAPQALVEQMYDAHDNMLDAAGHYDDRLDEEMDRVRYEVEALDDTRSEMVFVDVFGLVCDFQERVAINWTRLDEENCAYFR